MNHVTDLYEERQPMRRILTGLAVLSVVLGHPGFGAAEPGELNQLPPPFACIQENGDDVLCKDAHGLDGAYEAAISPDGKNLYVTALFGDTLAIFSRHTTTGVLTQLADPDGCLAQSGDGVTCTDATGLNGPNSVAVSPDGKHVYVGSNSGIAVFARNPAGGQLAQLPGADGCLRVLGGGATGCADIVGPIGPSHLTFTRDGKYLYAAAQSGDAVGVFARDRLTGVLTQLPAPAGCLAENGDGIECTDVVGLNGPDAIVLPRNGKQVYVASREGDTIAVFERDRTTGALTQFPAPAGCIAENGDGIECTDAVGLDGAASLAMSKTGRQLYVASAVGHSVAIFARNAATGVLTQLPAPSGCIAMNGDGVTCREAVSMFGATSIVATENGQHVYVAAPSSHAVVAFARDKKTGALTQLAAPNGCVSVTGDGSTCTNGLALNFAFKLVMPKNGAHLYVTSYGGDTIASFAREK